MTLNEPRIHGFGLVACQLDRIPGPHRQVTRTFTCLCSPAFPRALFAILTVCLLVPVIATNVGGIPELVRTV